MGCHCPAAVFFAFVACVIVVPSASLSSSTTVVPLRLQSHQLFNEGGAVRRRELVDVTSPLAGCASNVFSARVSVGGQPFMLIVDTGSTTLAVASSFCPSEAAPYGAISPCGTFPVYTPGAGASDRGTHVSGMYADGSGWVGEIFADSVQLGSAAPVRMNFVAMTSQKDFFSSYDCYHFSPSALNYQGILGLAYQPLAARGTDAFADAFFLGAGAPGRALPAVFALQLCDFTGRLWLGGYDALYTSAPPVWLAITNHAYYSVQAYSVAFKGVAYGSASTFGVAGPGSASNRSALLDSATTSTYLPASIFASLTAAITSDANFVRLFGADFFTRREAVPSAFAYNLTTAQLNALLPPLTVTFLAEDRVSRISVDLPAVPSYAYAVQVVDLSGSGAPSASFFFPGIMAGAERDNAIFGWSALSSYVSIWDRAGDRIGLAPAAFCDGSVPPGVAQSIAWTLSDWSPCSEGFAFREVRCEDQNELQFPPVACARALGTIQPDAFRACGNGSAHSGGATVQVRLVLSGLPALDAAAWPLAESALEGALTNALNVVSQWALRVSPDMIDTTAFVQRSGGAGGGIFFQLDASGGRRRTILGGGGGGIDSDMNMTIMSANVAGAYSILALIAAPASAAAVRASFVAEFAAIACLANASGALCGASIVVEALSALLSSAPPDPAAAAAAISVGAIVGLAVGAWIACVLALVFILIYLHYSHKRHEKGLGTAAPAQGGLTPQQAPQQPPPRLRSPSRQQQAQLQGGPAAGLDMYSASVVAIRTGSSGKLGRSARVAPPPRSELRV